MVARGAPCVPARMQDFEKGAERMSWSARVMSFAYFRVHSNYICKCFTKNNYIYATRIWLCDSWSMVTLVSVSGLWFVTSEGGRTSWWHWEVLTVEGFNGREDNSARSCLSDPAVWVCYQTVASHDLLKMLRSSRFGMKYMLKDTCGAKWNAWMREMCWELRPCCCWLHTPAFCSWSIQQTNIHCGRIKQIWTDFAASCLIIPLL